MAARHDRVTLPIARIFAAGAATLLVGACACKANDPSFAAAVLNPFGLAAVVEQAAPAFADIDGDGDADLFAGAGGEFSGVIAFFENTGLKSAPTFAEAADYLGLPNAISDSYLRPIPVFAPLYAASELDLLVGHAAGIYAYFEAYHNDGSSFSLQDPINDLPPGNIEFTQALAAGMVDLNGDGLVDAFVSTTTWFDPLYVNTISLFRNTGTVSAPVFTDQAASLDLVMPSSSYAYPTFVDIDADGDFDAFIGDENGDLWFFENTGTFTSASFAAAVENPFGLDTVPGGTAVPTFVDIDGDGDFDLFVGDGNGDFWFFENTDL